MLIIGGSGSGKTNTLLNLIKEEDSDNPIDKIYLYLLVSNFNEPKYQLLIKKREDARIKYSDDSKAFIKHSNTMDDIYNILLITTQQEKGKF